MASSPVYTSVLSSRAQKEIAQAWEWYEDRQRGLGDRFLKEVVSRLKKIEQSPDKYPTRFKTYKEATIPIFPYLVVFRIARKSKSIRIVSVFHTSLNPKKKYK